MTDSIEAVAGKTVRIRYVDSAGCAHDISAAVGETLMSAATSHLIAGIGGDCGGNCACGTCRIRVDPIVARTARPPDLAEQELLQFLGAPEAGLRLGCQIAVTREFDGATVVVAEAE
ncbi:2Fe-2S ferredoxin [Solimonas sp. K1W22B-7]|uniref:2Fe-2S iron-sulfur cluster-binding protein n=1 Tax=Solimonas sp. K1W22B-7 TaxID=2303331 RepID=UPI000E336E8E|nr:2Fe-2S iron-sulfur cluster-binding protein [Solimonas sp. K1W22B-7]AXQ30537.1 2Fe-2S ferredoxin [Solimonas sp. K1W22B-7]